MEQLTNHPEFSDFPTAISWYDKNLEQITRTRAPIISKNITIKSNAPWFDSEYALLRRKRRAAERRYKRSHLDIHKEEYAKLRKLTTNMANNKKRSFITQKIRNCPSKLFFKTVSTLLDETDDFVLPAGKPDTEVAEEFKDYFINKISLLRQLLPSIEHSSLSKSTVSGYCQILETLPQKRLR